MQKEEHMKKSIGFMIGFSLLAAVQAAASPIPTFDKEAVTVHPYNRTGEPDALIDRAGADQMYREGNTGTEENPAFYIREIRLTGQTLPDKKGKLAAILKKYSGRNVQVSEISSLQKEIAEYARSVGYTVPLAAVPPQEIRDGVLEIRVYLAAYDKITLEENNTDVADSVLEKYMKYLHEGETITDRELESVMNNINDLPGVTAAAVLEPGSEPGTTSVGVRAERRPVWNNYIFTDNGGGYYSGRYRYGFNTEINNPGHQGDKIILNGMITSHDVENYGIRYETPVGSRGTRWGLAYSKSSYDLPTTGMFDSVGRSEGLSFYGLTPLYRDRSNRVTAIYGYDRRDIKDEIRFKTDQMQGVRLETNKTADVWHAGISGSQYNVNQFTQYNLIYWYGDIRTDGGGAYYDGGYHKLTFDLLNIWYDGRWNYRISFRSQLANRALDGSEQFYLGGINGVRAYGNSDGYGDMGYLATGEIRYGTSVPGLELAAFTDVGAVKNRAMDTMDHLAGWGVGLRYSKNGDWYAQLDYARKIDGRPDRTEPDDHDGRIWFQLYKLF